MAVEVFTIGGGEYIVNTLNAVAAWTGQGGYKSMIQVVMVMGLIYASLIVAFNADWRAWINWFLQATLIYMCLMVPRVDVHVTDRINPSLAAADIANVPLGLGMVASFTSQISDYLTRGAELVFGLPDDLNYSTNGMLYGVRLLQATQQVRINEPMLATNLDEHYRQCVFYDILLGHKSIETFAQATDILAAMAPGSPARSQKWIAFDPSSSTGGTTTSIITCQDAVSRIGSLWSGYDDSLFSALSRQLYPGMLPDAAKAKLYADLPVAYQYLTGVSETGTRIMQQNLLVNAMGQAMHTMPASGGGSSLDVYAQTKADLQTTNTYASIGSTAMKWVPLLNIVLTVVFYALFPIAFPIFLLPGGGVSALKGYVTGFFYLAAWGPLYVILHMILMLRASSSMTALALASGSQVSGNVGAGVGMTLASSVGIAGVSDDIGVLAGYMVASIPFLAAGIARGALAISGQATSFLAPSQAAAEDAARDVTTGNIALGNTSFDNQSFNNRQGNLWTTAGAYTAGAASLSSVENDGTRTTQYPGATVVDAGQAISRLPFTPQVSSELQSTFTKNASESRSRAETLSNSAAETASAATTQAVDFRRQVSAGTTLDTSYGADDRKVISDTFSHIDQTATALQNKFGFDRNQAESYATEWALSGNLTTGAPQGSIGGKGKGALVGAGSALGAGVTTNASRRTGTSQTITGSDGLSEVKDFLQSESHNQSWSANRDSFFKAASSSTSGTLNTAAQNLSSSFTRANSAAREARTSFEEARRFESAASLRDSNGDFGQRKSLAAIRQLCPCRAAEDPRYHA